MARGRSRSAILGVLSGSLIWFGLLLAAPRASAKAAYDSPYGYDRTWNAALRLVRVDNGWKVVEKDEGTGYLLFEYRSAENAHPTPGSVELIRSQEGSSVGVVVQLPQMPRYHEQVLLDALAAKMRREYGDPPIQRKAPTPPPVPDAPGPDAGAD